MIVLDTDVFSAVLKSGYPGRDGVIAWLDRQAEHELCITAVTQFEVLSGIEKLAEGRKRRALEGALSQAMEMFEGRVLPFDRLAAEAAGNLYGARRRGGRTVGMADTQIAGIAISVNASVATRNTRHFSDISVPVINPWES